MNGRIMNLVFEGTGVRNSIYVGGLLALEEAGLYAGVQAFAGTSSGSIVATLAAIGCSPQEIERATMELDFSKILDGSVAGGLARLLTSYGWFKGDYFLERMQELVEKKTGSARISFAECKRRGYHDLRIVGSNVTKRTVRVFPDEGSEGMAIVDAVRISMAIPLFFASRRFQGDVYVDGGVMWNYPIGVFDELGTVNDETLGFHVENSALPHTNHTLTPHDYFAGLFGCLVRQQEADLENRPLDRARTISVGDQGILVTDFGIGVEKKRALLEAGRSATRSYLAERMSVAAPEIAARTTTLPPASATTLKRQADVRATGEAR
ncbi:MAG TPA: patatin-like phospholipase family protein [Polyangiaceae bacterium]|nr:patatin-like phospholipase family protein [Polyangiaceae bacterium]